MLGSRDSKIQENAEETTLPPKSSHPAKTFNVISGCSCSTSTVFVSDILNVIVVREASLGIAHMLYFF